MLELLSTCCGDYLCPCCDCPDCDCLKGDVKEKKDRPHIKYSPVNGGHRQQQISTHVGVYELEPRVVRSFSFPQEQSYHHLHPLFTIGTSEEEVQHSQPRHQLQSQISSLSLADTPYSAGPRRLSATAERGFTLPSDGRAWRHSLHHMQTLVEQDDDQDTSDMPVSSLTLDRARNPTLKFSLYYDIQQHSLRFHLVRASNLPAKDRSGLSDPYVCIFLDPNREEMFESEIKFKTLNPEFDEHFVFKKLMPNELSFQKLVIRVYDYNKYSRNNFIGAIVLPLREADLLGAPDVFKIDESPKLAKVASEGDLLLSLTYSPNSNRLEGIALKATNLAKKDFFGTADPYVKVNLVYKGRRLIKWKSDVKKNTQAPIFNELFNFDITDLDLNSIVLEVIVMDFDRFMRNDVIGFIHIGKTVDYSSGRKHWREIVNSPHHGISRWHSLNAPQPRTRSTTV